MFEGFQLTTIDTGETTIRARHGGNGPPLLLLHGHPQTHVMWHLVAPRLARDFTVVATDLRGYGDSGKPPTMPDHEPYSKRAMARDQIEGMRQLGFERFLVAGHDRGGRVAYRMALDHPERVLKLAVLDIIPTSEHFRRADMAFALGYWHWFFLAQPEPLPERLIAADPDAFYLRRRDLFAPEALAEYRRCFHDPATIHATCEDYRAGATYDFALDEADRGVRRIACPVLALWGSQGALPAWYDVLSVWRDWADDVRGRALDCGHYLAEEMPEETYGELCAFFAGKESGNQTPSRTSGRTNMELTAKGAQSLEAINHKIERVREFMAHRPVPNVDTSLRQWFAYLAEFRGILGNFSNDLSLVSCLMAQDFLMRTLPMKPFDIATKPQGASGLDIDEETVAGERVVGEIKTTVPYHGMRLGAAQIREFKKDFAKLARTEATHKFLFVTDAAAFALMTRRYASLLEGVTVVNLATGEQAPVRF